jgi:ribose-phosphate pyrophosphokinase
MSQVAVFAFDDEAAAAGRLADALGVPLRPISLHRFPDGEVLPQAPAAPARAIVYRSLDHPNEKLIALLLAADALRRAGAQRLVLVAPYLCYLRQDTVFAPGQPVSRDVIGRLLAGAFDRLLTVQAHLHRTPDLSAAFGMRAESLNAAGVLSPLFEDQQPTIVVGPDAESSPWVADWSRALGCPAVTLCKQRHGDRDVRFARGGLEAVAGRRAILVDDVASSGVTLARAARRLAAAHVAAVDVAVVHPLFEPRALARLRRAGVRRIVSTDSIAHATNAARLAPSMARALADEITP